MTETTISPEEKEAARRATRAAKERERRARIKREKEAATAANGVAGTPGQEPAWSRSGVTEAAGAAEPKPARTPKDPEAVAILTRAKELAPEIKSPYQAFEVRSLIKIVGSRDPIAFLDLPEEALKGGDARDLALRWARGTLDSKDPVAAALRARARVISKHPEAKNLWGRKIGALLVAMADARAAS